MISKRARLLFILSWGLFSFPPRGFGQDPPLSKDDAQFLEEVQKKAFDYFYFEHHPETGLVKDKASNFGRDSSNIASIAATGFGLAAMVVGAEKGWISKREAQSYCTKTLRFFLNRMEAHHGFFYHFVRWETGKKTNPTELSSIDTALFLAGALTAGEYFKGTEVERLANELYERVDFVWMLHGRKTLSMGWLPDQGFLRPRWDQYNESFILYLLAIGSPTHPLSSESWHQVSKRIGVYGPYVLIYSPPLFTHQYSAIWVDFRNKNDGFADYFENSRTATLANRQFSLDHRSEYKTYSENIWGLTASLGPAGYKAYGSEPGGAIYDGTVAPTAAGSSIVFTPELSLAALKAMRENFKDKIWGKYGFSDSFNLDRNWYAQEVLGIDQGPLLLMIENFRTELVWKFFMRHPAVLRGMDRIGFKPGRLVLKRPERPVVVIPRMKGKFEGEGDLKDWDLARPLKLEYSRHRELGEIDNDQDLMVKLFLTWDETFLYVAAIISDDSLVAKRKGSQIWKDDCLELFFDPAGDGLEWGNPDDVQLGFSPSADTSFVRSWSWFQNFDPQERKSVKVAIQNQSGGYHLEARIAWEILGISPRANFSFGFTPAFHDEDQDGSEGKLNWFMLPDGKRKRIFLGRAVLSGN